MEGVTERIKAKEEKRKERQREDNEEWRRRQENLRRRNIESTGIHEFQGSGVGRMQVRCAARIDRIDWIESVKCKGY